MKKIAILLAVFTFSFANAQAPLEEGGLQLNAGFGTSGWGTPVYVGLDYGIAPNFTLEENCLISLTTKNMELEVT